MFVMEHSGDEKTFQLDLSLQRVFDCVLSWDGQLEASLVISSC